MFNTNRGSFLDLMMVKSLVHNKSLFMGICTSNCALLHGCVP